MAKAWGHHKIRQGFAEQSLGCVHSVSHTTSGSPTETQRSTLNTSDKPDPRNCHWTEGTLTLKHVSKTIVQFFLWGGHSKIGKWSHLSPQICYCTLMLLAKSQCADSLWLGVNVAISFKYFLTCLHKYHFVPSSAWVWVFLDIIYHKLISHEQLPVYICFQPNLNPWKKERKKPVILLYHKKDN